MTKSANNKWLCTLTIACLVGLSTTGQHRVPLVSNHQKVSDTDGSFDGTLSNSDRFGRSIAAIGDLNGDGVTDLAVGESHNDDGGTNRGGLWILFMNSDGTIASEQKISDTDGSFTGTLTNSGYFGLSVAAIGDLDSDGVPDLAVGNPYDDDGGTDRGALWILFMESDGTVKSHQKISDTNGSFTGTLANADRFGQSVADIGDLNDDGVTDLAVGAILDDDGGANRGACWVLFMNTDGTVSSHQKISDTQGSFTGPLANTDYFGSGIAGLGDLNNDGVEDIAVGAYGDDNGGQLRGAVYVLFMNTDGTVSSHQEISDRLTGKIDALTNSEYFGSSVANAGDVNRDGTIDLLVGAYYAGVTHEGSAYLVTLNTDGTAQDFRKITEGYGWEFSGLDNSDFFGVSVAGIGDLDGDGYVDWAIGVLSDDDGGTDRGAFYVLFSDDNAGRALEGGYTLIESWIQEDENGFTGTLDASDYFGVAVVEIGDVDNDGNSDLAISATGDDDGGTNRGAVYILFMDSDGSVDSYQKISDTEGSFTATLDDNDEFGSALVAPGDVDGDGVPDLLVGVPNDDDGGTNRGAVYTLYLNTNGTVDTYQKISDTQGSFSATLNDDDRFGSSVAVIGDLDSDTYTDYVIGCENDDDDHPDAGALYVLFLSSTETVDSYHKINETSGDIGSAFLTSNSSFGESVVAVGDVDADGIPDLAVAERTSSSTGRVFVLLLDTDGSVSSLSATGTSQLPGELEASDFFGLAMAAPGDLNNDQVPDLIASASGDDDGETSAGAIYTLFLNSDGSLQSYDKHSRTEGHVTTLQKINDSYGEALAWLNDIDGDGMGELAVGARKHEPGKEEGVVYIYNVPAAAAVNTDVYARPQKQLDAGYVYTRECNLNFAFREDYEPQGNLEFYIFDADRSEQLSWNDQSVSISHGDNRCSIDVSSLTHDYYILEVVNAKDERWYLRFKHDATLGSCP